MPTGKPDSKVSGANQRLFRLSAAYLDVDDCRLIYLSWHLLAGMVFTFIELLDTPLPKAEIVPTRFPALRLLGTRFITASQSSHFDLPIQTIRPLVKHPVQNRLLAFMLPSTSRYGFVVGFLDASGLLPR